MPPAFLMQQMAWREALDDASTLAELDVLGQQVLVSRGAALQACAVLLDDQGDATGAVQQVRALMFIERFSVDVQLRQDRLEAAERGQ
jgi:molecular chaperone HscB